MSGDRAALITAAGASSRMGAHKALLPWCGRALIAHQVRTLGDYGFDPVVVVTGAAAPAVRRAVPEGACTVRAEEWREGRSRSIEVGAAALPDQPDVVLVVGVDQPLVPRVLAELVARAGAPVVQPVDEAGEPGHPVILGGGQVDALRAVSAEKEGLRTLVRRLRPDGALVRIEDLPRWDLNDPRDYRRARARMGRAQG